MPDDEQIVQRVESILREMGWDENDLARGIYRRLGYKTPKGVSHWFNREPRQIPTRGVLAIALYLGVDSAYILTEHDDLARTADPQGRYILATKPRHGAA